MSEITDKEAVDVLHKQNNKNNRYATKFIDRTIVYPVVVTRAGAEEIEIRTFTRAGEYISPRRYEKALEVEKQYKELNNDYTQSLRDAGISEKRIVVKELANPTNFTPMYED